MGSPAGERRILTASLAFWPGLSLLAHARRAAAVVLRDDLPLDTSRGLHRARLRGAGGEAWLSLPLRAAPAGTPVAGILLAPTLGFAARAMRAVEHAFEEAPFFEHHRCDLARILFHPWDRYAPMAAAMTRFLFSAYGVRAELLRATELPGGIPADARGIRHATVSDRSAVDALFWHGPAARSLLRIPLREGAPARRSVRGAPLALPRAVAR